MHTRIYSSDSTEAILQDELYQGITDRKIQLEWLGIEANI